ncbi:uncharacterized protein LOC131657899 [Vicia villosa]|uniref:uncharacterized protein LOC131657899 n=1 Tax=Vicia villosa TaxID=3911 RepID=UPI00273B2832|nr:uncharacterized protein LOC131657899 [Vicia villosa]
MYAGFSIKGKCFIDVLHFADDTLLVGNGSWNNLWAIKAVLRGFELILGLGINFYKSKLIGCRREENDFISLRIRIGSNPRRISTWKPHLSKIRKMMSSWEGRHINVGGRLTLLKSVLGSLAIFNLSFYKAPKFIIKEITKIQSNFLWGGKMDKRCIHWGRWKRDVSVAAMGGWSGGIWHWGDLGTASAHFLNAIAAAEKL